MTRVSAMLMLALALLVVPAVASAQWETPSRAFHKTVVFPLEGRHLDVPCASCHIKGQVKGTPTTCADCHWNRRQDDKYQTRLGMACEQCHRPTTWTATRWDHGTATGMPLNVAHKTMSCDTCHKNGLFTGVNLTCGSCHAKDYQATRTPDHKAAGFPTNCELCHRPSDSTFTQGRFDHNSTYQLAGVHATVDCVSCHRGGVYKGTPRDCVGCHRTDYQKTTTPNHASAGFSTSCESCHKATDPSWRGNGTFNHNSVFQLVGTHAAQACTSCHVNNLYKGTPRDCVGCHRDDYQKTTAPNHAAAGYSTTCDSCHRATDPSWRNGSFNHASVFQLVGNHATQTCASCHVNGIFKGTPRTCTGCHLDEYQRTTAPNHASVGFSTTCDTCHRATDPSWRGGSFNHNTVFQLLGKHATAVCGVCHVNNVYKGTPRDCVGCHKADYDRTLSPSHVAARFPTTCEVCHKAGDGSWTQGTFNHTWFPITSGRHSGNPCSACHTNPANYTQFTCLTCHTRTETDNEHRGRAGYSYDSLRCYACHPTGRS